MLDNANLKESKALNSHSQNGETKFSAREISIGSSANVMTDMDKELLLFLKTF